MVIIKTSNPFAHGTFAVIIRSSTGIRPSPATPVADIMGLRVQEKTLRLRIMIPNVKSSVILRLINSRGENAKTLYDAGLRGGVIMILRCPLRRYPAAPIHLPS
jgi:hypothetical protein